MQLQDNPTLAVHQLHYPTTVVKDIVLLDGLFGNLSNWKAVQQEFKPNYQVCIPQPFFNYFLGGDLNKLDAQKQNLKELLHFIKIPILLIWGLQDIVTPFEVSEECYQHLSNATLHFIDRCDHASMMAQNELFNGYVSNFLAS